MRKCSGAAAILVAVGIFAGGWATETLANPDEAALGRAALSSKEAAVKECSNGSNANIAIDACTSAIQWGDTARGLSIDHANRGLQYRNIGNLPAALADFDQAISLDQSNDFAWSERCGYYANKDANKAIPDCDQAIALNPQNHIAWEMRGLSYENNRDYSHAIQDYDQALKLDPNNVPLQGARQRTMQESRSVQAQPTAPAQTSSEGAALPAGAYFVIPGPKTDADFQSDNNRCFQQRSPTQDYVLCMIAIGYHLPPGQLTLRGDQKNIIFPGKRE